VNLPKQRRVDEADATSRARGWNTTGAQGAPRDPTTEFLDGVSPHVDAQVRQPTAAARYLEWASALTPEDVLAAPGSDAGSACRGVTSISFNAPTDRLKFLIARPSPSPS
jgi:hypothetical protein